MCILQESFYIKFKNRKQSSIILNAGTTAALGEQMTGRKHGLCLCATRNVLSLDMSAGYMGMFTL